MCNQMTTSCCFSAPISIQLSLSRRQALVVALHDAISRWDICSCCIYRCVTLSPLPSHARSHRWLIRCSDHITCRQSCRIFSGCDRAIKRLTSSSFNLTDVRPSTAGDRRSSRRHCEGRISTTEDGIPSPTSMTSLFLSFVTQETIGCSVVTITWVPKPMVLYHAGASKNPSTTARLPS
jgi:hypothetical protein